MHAFTSASTTADQSPRSPSLIDSDPAFSQLERRHQTGAKPSPQSASPINSTCSTGTLRVYDTEIVWLLATHPDTRIFTSLPGIGPVSAATLLAGMGECRRRLKTRP